MLRKAGWAALLLSLLAPCARAQSKATLMGVELYRSGKITEEQLQKKIGPLLESYVRMRNDGRRSVLKSAERLKVRMEAEVRGLGRFAYVHLHYGDYVTSAERTAYVTFDVVDKKDVKSRMPFKPAPKGKVADPDGLVASWQQYSDLGMTLMGQGLLTMEHSSCPAYFCLWGSATPELAALERRFTAGAAPREKELRAVLEREADGRKRAAAVYLLSYLRDGKAVSRLMTEALADPAEEVRGAALQVISDISLYHKDVFIDVGRVIPVLDYPATTDRSRVLGVLIGLSDSPVYRPYVLTRATPYLLRLLKTRQPSVHDLAFTLLSLLSKESYDRRDYASWEKWISLQQ